MWKEFDKPYFVVLVDLLEDTRLNCASVIARYRPEKYGGGRYVDDPGRWDLRESVPGEPATDYPVYASIPTTSFSCQGRSEGYHADPETRCQVFHVCAGPSPLPKSSALCPNGSVFNQDIATCDWWSNVDCPGSAVFRAGRPLLPIPEYSGNLVLPQAERLVGRPRAQGRLSTTPRPTSQPATAASTFTSDFPPPAQRTSGAEDGEGSAVLSTGLQPPLETQPSLQKLEDPAGAVQLRAFASSFTHTDGYLPPGDGHAAEVIIPTPGTSAGSTVKLSAAGPQKVGAPALSFGPLSPSTAPRPVTLTEGPSPLPETSPRSTSPQPGSFNSSTPSPVPSESPRPVDEYTAYPPSAAFAVSKSGDVAFVSSTPSPLPITNPATVETFIPSSTPAPGFYTSTIPPLVLNSVSGAAPGFTQTVVSSMPFPISNGSPESLQELRISSPVQRLNDILLSSTPAPPPSIYFTGSGTVGAEIVDSGRLELSAKPAISGDTIVADLQVSSTPAPPLSKYFSGIGTTETGDIVVSSTPAPPPPLYFTGNVPAVAQIVDSERGGVSAKTATADNTVVGDLQQSSTPAPPLSKYFSGIGTTETGDILLSSTPAPSLSKYFSGIGTTETSDILLSSTPAPPPAVYFTGNAPAVAQIVDNEHVGVSAKTTTASNTIFGGIQQSSTPAPPSSKYFSGIETTGTLIVDSAPVVASTTPTTFGDRIFNVVPTTSTVPPDILAINDATQSTVASKQYSNPFLPPLAILGRERVYPLNRFVSFRPSPAVSDLLLPASFVSSSPSPFLVEATSTASPGSSEQPVSTPATLVYTQHSVVVPSSGSSPQDFLPTLPVTAELKSKSAPSSLPTFRYGERLSSEYSSLPEQSLSLSPEVSTSKPLTGGSSATIYSSSSSSDNQISNQQGGVLQQLTLSQIKSQSLTIQDGSSTRSPPSSGYFSVSEQPVTSKQQGKVSVQILSSPGSESLSPVDASYSNTGSLTSGSFAGGFSSGPQAVAAPQQESNGLAGPAPETDVVQRAEVSVEVVPSLPAYLGPAAVEAVSSSEEPRPSTPSPFRPVGAAEAAPSLPPYLGPPGVEAASTKEPRPSKPSPFRPAGGLRVVVPDTLYGVPVAGKPPQPSPDVDQPPLLVPSISFSFDTPEGRQEFEAAVAAGLLDSSKR